MNLQVEKSKNELEQAVNNSNLKINNMTKREIKILIADDYKPLCKALRNILNKYKELEVIGIANTDQEEISKIEDLKPRVVITDIKRNNQYTGLDIVKQYSDKKDSPYFFIISSEIDEKELNNNHKIIGFMRKPFLDYDKIVKEILEIIYKFRDI